MRRLTRHYNANDSYNHYQIYHNDGMLERKARHDGRSTLIREGKHEENSEKQKGQFLRTGLIAVNWWVVRDSNLRPTD